MGDAMVELNGSGCRIKKCAFDLLSIESDVWDDKEESWNFLERFLCLKSTFLFCDFNRIIAAASGDRKKAVAELGDELFCAMQELDQAVKSRSITLTQDGYSDVAAILQQVIAFVS